MYLSITHFNTYAYEVNSKGKDNIALMNDKAMRIQL